MNSLDPPLKDGELGTLAGYRVLSLLGEGGMGKVYRALDSRLQREVALKVMQRRPHGPADASERFLREARAMAAVKHDNVATIYEVGEHSGIPYLAMELLAGKSLDAALTAGDRFTPQQIIALGRHVARGLAAAHARGIVHRDVKPANIWLDAATGRPKLLDFGLARQFGDAIGKQRGAVAGTPGYLSPEQARDDPVDDRTDVYGLGVVLFELLTGRLPFNENNVTSLLITILTQPPPQISTLAPQAPAPLAAFVEQMLAKEPHDRPKSATVVEQRLKQIAEELERAKDALLDIPIGDLSKSSARLNATKAVGAEASDSGSKRKLWIASGAVGAVLLVAIVSGLAWYFGFGRSAAPQPQTAQVPPVDTGPAITPAALTVLQLERLEVMRAPVPQGEPAELQFDLANRASLSNQDPAMRFAGVREVCQIVITAQTVDAQQTVSVPLFPYKVSARQLPAQGATRRLQLRFNTATFNPGEYQLKVTLQTPDGKPVRSELVTIAIVQNLLKIDLTKLSPLRTWNLRGADLTLFELPQPPATGATPLQVGQTGATGSVATYVRFDLSQTPVPLAQLDNAVLSATLQKDAPGEARTLQVYGIADGKDGGAWAESGDATWTWAAAPDSIDATSAIFLGSWSIDNTGNIYAEQTDGVRFSSPELVNFLKQDQDGLVTLVLKGKGAGDPTLKLFSKELDPERAPALTLLKSTAPM